MKNFFSHDEGARNDPKLIKVLMRLGQAGKGVYWDLIEMLYEQNGYLLLAECESYAFALRTECDLLTKLITEFELFENDGTRFWSASALRRLAQRKGKSEKASESAAKRWQNASAMRTHSEGNANKGKEKKGNTAEAVTHEQAAADSASLEKPEASPAELPADEAPVFTAAGFAAFVTKMAYGHIDKGRYLLDIQRKAESLKPRTNAGWENYILAWLKRDLEAGHLLTATGTVTTRPGFGPPPTATVATGSYDRAALVAKQATQIVT
jgi:hypothetical protein